MKSWTDEVARSKGADKAKYTKLSTGAEAIKDLSATQPEKFRRGYAVLLSAAQGGLDTEEAVFGATASTKDENEQVAWDKYNLRGALKRVLVQAVAEGPTVDFAAATVQKGGVRVFVNPASEKKISSGRSSWTSTARP